MKTAMISRCYVPNFGNSYHHNVTILYSGFPTGESRLCKTYAEAEDFARMFGATVEL